MGLFPRGLVYYPKSRLGPAMREPNAGQRNAVVTAEGHLKYSPRDAERKAGVAVVSRQLTAPSQELGYTFPIALVASAEPLMRASYVSESNHLRQRASEMRASSKELKDDNTAAVIMRLADLYDRLADRAETRGNRAVRSDRAQPKEDGLPTRS